MSELKILSQMWLASKQAEADAIERRRRVEDQISAIIGIDPTNEKTTTQKEGDIKIQVTSRLSQSIDAKALQEIAAENGTSEHMSALFSWKPSISKTAWKATDKTITDPLLAAITTKPGRPTYKITIQEEN